MDPQYRRMNRCRPLSWLFWVNIWLYALLLSVYCGVLELYVCMVTWGSLSLYFRGHKKESAWTVVRKQLLNLLFQLWKILKTILLTLGHWQKDCSAALHHFPVSWMLSMYRVLYISINVDFIITYFSHHAKCFFIFLIDLVKNVILTFWVFFFL